jgi:hypothetical protein
MFTSGADHGEGRGLGWFSDPPSDPPGLRAEQGIFVRSLGGAESDVGERLNDGVESGRSGARGDRLIVAAGQHVAGLSLLMGRCQLPSALLGLLLDPALAKLSFAVELCHRGLPLSA